ncbi:hypothetical protein Tco_0246154 [Tanacetum coccineum]
MGFSYWSVFSTSEWSADVLQVTFPTYINGMGTSGAFVYSDCIPNACIGGIENNLLTDGCTTHNNNSVANLGSKGKSWRKYCQVEHKIMEADKLQPHYSRPDIRLCFSNDGKFLAMMKGGVGGMGELRDYDGTNV